MPDDVAPIAQRCRLVLILAKNLNESVKRTFREALHCQHAEQGLYIAFMNLKEMLILF